MIKKWKGFATGLLVATLCVSPAFAGSATSVTKLVPASSDAVLSLPVSKEAVETVTVNGAPVGVAVTVDSITGSGYAGAYYVRVMTGPAAGLWSTIDSVSGTQIDLASSEIAGKITDGAELRIYPHCTIGDIFPSERFGISFVVGTSILIFDNSSSTVGQNPLPTNPVTYVNNRGSLLWSGQDGEDTVLPPETTFIVRNGSATETLSVSMVGALPDYPVAFLVPDSQDEDLRVGSGYPVDVTLGKTLLNGAVGRSVLVYDNQASGLNKLPEAVTWVNNRGNLLWSGTGSLVDGAGTQLLAGDGITVRANSESTDGVAKIVKPY